MSNKQSTVKDYISRIDGICGGDKNVIVVFKSEKTNIAIANILKRCIVKKSHSDFMIELEFQNVTFRLFNSGRAVFRSIKNKRELNRLLAALLL